jgi:hypothetical protein
MWFLVENSGHYIESSQTQLFCLVYLRVLSKKMIGGSKIRHMNSMEQKVNSLVKLMFKISYSGFRKIKNLSQFFVGGGGGGV